MLKIKDLKTSVDGKEILKGIDLEVGSGRRPGHRRGDVSDSERGRSGPEGEIHVLMGPNGSGKSTLAQVIAGAPQFTINSGQLTFNGKDIRKLTPDKRAKLGIFLGFQHPVEIPGVSVFNVLRRVKGATLGSTQGRSLSGRQEIQGSTLTKRQGTILNSSLPQFRQQLLEHAYSLKLSNDFIRRSLNEGFSGGEKKRSEILQMLALKPKLVILDEIDSGLDVDGLKTVAGAIKQFTVNNPQSSVILITHYARILKHLKPDFVHVMVDGRVVKSGKASLATEIERKGYGSTGSVLVS